MTAFAPYQVDYSAKNASKTLGFSKKKVTFKFGFANRKSLQDGLTGPACRGSEHEITFVWTLNNGKRQLYVDGKEVHYSESGQNGWMTDRAWQHSFYIRVPGMGSYKAHFISQPVNRDDPTSKPFDLLIQGVSFFRFNQIFQLGTPSMMVREGPGTHHSGRDSPMTAEERRQLAQAKLESLRDLREVEERKRTTTEERNRASTENSISPSNQLQRQEQNLINFDDPPPPVQVAPINPTTTITSQGNIATASYGNLMSSVTLDPAIDDQRNLQQPYGYPSQQPPQPTDYRNQMYPNPYVQQQQQPPQPPVSAPYNGSSMSITPYQPPAGQPAPSPYIDATGRLSMGQQQQQQQPQPYGQQPQSYAPPYGQPQPYATAAADPMQTYSQTYMPQQQQQPTYGANQLNSPSNQSYSSYASYGSAPAFAQPPRPPQQQQATATTMGYAPSSMDGYPTQSYNPYQSPY